MTDDACFFRLSNRTENGKLVDMSRIPGGYGIYILPYVQSEADSFPDTYLCADQLACFFPLDPAVEIRHLGLTPDGSALVLHTVENNIYYVTLIDVKTAAVLQKLAVMDDFTDEDYTNITETDDFTCIRVSERRICVLTQEADGQFQVALTSDFDSELPFAVGYSSISEMAFDGERLALVRNDVDFVLTFEEVLGMFAAKGVDKECIPADEAQKLSQAGADARKFAVSGGVAQAVVNAIKSIDPTREVKIAKATGLHECRKLLMMARDGKYDGYLLEGMACPGGCVAGAGTLQPIDRSTRAVAKFADCAEYSCAYDTQYKDFLPLIEEKESEAN